MDELKKLQEQCKKLQEELKRLKDQNKTLKEVAAKQKVKEIISAKKLSPEQESWAVEYALKDEKGFEEFIKNAKPIITAPDDNQFSASSKPTDIDVVKMAIGGDYE